MIGKHAAALSAAIVFGLASIPALAQEAPAQGGTVTVAVEGLIGHLDPHISNSGLTHNINDQIFEKLFARDLTVPNDGSPPIIIPRLATGYEVSADGLVYTISLREGVKFHDGTNFNAEAAAFNIRRIWDKEFEFYYADAGSLNSAVFSNLANVEVIDPNKIRLTLSSPFSFFIDGLAESIGLGLAWMLSPASVIDYGNEEVRNHPVGTGAFKFVEEVKGQHLVLAKNDDYWDAPYPYLDRLVFRPVSEPAARVNALLAGEADVIMAVPTDQIEQLEAEGFEIAQGATPHIWYMEFNHSEPPFDDVRVRQAVNLAIDRQAMTEQLLSGGALPANCFCGRTSSTFVPMPEWAGYEFDPVRARELLAQAGYPDGFTTVFETSTEGSGQLLPVQIGEWIQSDLAKVGIEMELRTFEWNTYVGRWYSGLEPGIGMNQISTGSNSDYWIYLVAYSKSQANSGHHTDAVFDDLLDRANATTDLEERSQLIREAVKREKEEAHHAPIANDTFPVGLSSRVNGFIRAADWPVDFRIVWVSD